MFIAVKSLNEVKTDLRTLRDEHKTALQELCLLRESTDSRIVNLQSEWRQVLGELEDTLDKINHQAQRLQKRQSRARLMDETQEVGSEETRKVARDPTTAKVLARRRRHAIRPKDVPR